MPRDHEDGRDTLERFALLSKTAKMQKRLDNIGSEAERGRAGDAVEVLVAFADECSAMQSHKSSNDDERPFAQDLQERLAELSEVLDTHVGPGNDVIGVRRALLEKTAIYATAHPDDDLDNEEIAESLNTSIGRLDAPDGSSSGLAIMPTFTASEARRLVDLARARNQIIEERIEELGTLFSDTSRDDTRALRSLFRRRERAQTKQAIARLQVDVLTSISEPQRDLLQRIGRQQAQRHDRSLAKLDDDLEFATFFEPQASGGKRKRNPADLSDDDTSPPAQKRRIRSLGHRGRAAPTFAIHEDGDAAQAEADSFQQRYSRANLDHGLAVQDETADRPDATRRPVDPERRALMELRRSDLNSRTR